jgi:hypothetical protein
MSGSGGDADLYLYPPGTTDIYSDPYVASSTEIGNDELIQGTANVTGYWYIDVYAYDDSTNYNFTATLSTLVNSENTELRGLNSSKPSVR